MNSTTAENKEENRYSQEAQRKRGPQTHREVSREAEGEQESRGAGNQKTRGFQEMVPDSVQGCREIKLKKNSVVPSGFRCQEVTGVFRQSSVCGVMGAGLELQGK